MTQSRDRSAERSRCNVSRTGRLAVTLASQFLAPKLKGQVISAPEQGPFR
jgi:hypothetical protein